MLCITVAQDGSGHFASISEAVLAVPYDCPAQIRIGAGIYREKLVCEKKDIALQIKVFSIGVSSLHIVIIAPSARIRPRGIVV